MLMFQAGGSKMLSKISKIVPYQNTKRSYILDEENALILVKDAINKSNIFTLIHERIIDGKLVKLNKIDIPNYNFYIPEKELFIPKTTLFKVQGKYGYDALYDYKKAKFVIPQGKWDSIIFNQNGVNLLKKYNGFIAYFEIKSNLTSNDIYSYKNIFDNKIIINSFSYRDGYYYGILNLDGTIRENKLFKSKERDFTRIEEVIDLNNYETLEQFKNERQQICEIEKQKQIENYFNEEKAREEAFKVLKLNK